MTEAISIKAGEAIGVAASAIYPVERPLHRFIATEKRAGFFTIPPSEAGVVLEHYNDKNRPINGDNVDRLAKDMESGDWDNDTGDPIQFDSNGKLLNGQHRLMGCVKSGKSISVAVIWGLPPHTMKYVDGAYPRNTSLRMLLDEAVDGTRERPTHSQVTYRQKEYAVVKMWLNQTVGKVPRSVAELEAFRKDHEPALAVSLRAVSNTDARKTGYKAACAIYFEKHPAKAEEFIQLVGGVDTDNLPSPVVRLREYLARSTASRGTKRRKSSGGNTMVDTYETTVAMIHAFHNGETVKRVTAQKEWTI